MSGIYPFRSADEFQTFKELGLSSPERARAALVARGSGGDRAEVRMYSGPPGTGKTVQAVQRAVYLVDPAFPQLEDPAQCFQALVSDYRDRITFLTFHAGVQYEDLVESIRPLLDDESDTISYRRHEGPILDVIQRARRCPDEQFVLIIDEINRADVARALGSLITALEADKREGAAFPVAFESIYQDATAGDSRIMVPRNVHVLATMNTADRNLATLDFAMRRRFEFVECRSQPAVLPILRTQHGEIDLRAMLKHINDRIALYLGAEYEIGHGYLMQCGQAEDVARIMARQIVPLLREYFIGDDETVRNILADEDGGMFSVVDPVADGVPMRANLHLAQRITGFDARFWDEAAIPPNPGDEAHATECLQRIYGA